ncbi:MAG: protein kinase [Zavarzinella sp.]
MDALSSASYSSLDSAIWLQRERLIARFEDDWRAGKQPKLARYVQQHDSELELIVELIHVDIAYRARTDKPAMVEDYLQQFPELRNHSELLLDLIESEYHARSGSGSGSTIESYRERFPDLSDVIAERLKHAPVEINTTQLQQVTDQPIDQIGHYELYEKIGQGGFGTIYRGKDIALNRIVAMKIALPNRIEHDQAERFIREAQAAAQLRHPNIMAVYESGRSDDGRWFIASAYLPGGTLLERFKSGLSIRETVEGIAQVADGLQYAHQKHILHRDIKPANLMFDDESRVQIVDFGLARYQMLDSMTTMEGTVLGTPAYMSPEQAGGKIRNLDHRSDIYSLGATLYHLVTGKTPFQGRPTDVIHAVIHQHPPEPRKHSKAIPKDLNAIILKAMAKAPEKRYQHASEFALDLRRFLNNEPVAARNLGYIRKTVRLMLRYRLESAFIISFIFTVAIATVLITLKYFEAKESNQRAQDRSEAAFKNYISGEQQADELRMVIYNLLNNQVLDGIEPIRLTTIPDSTLEKLASNIDKTLQYANPARMREELVQLYRCLAFIRKLQGKYDLSAIALEKVHPQQPAMRDSTDILLELAAVSFKAGEYSKAINQYQIVLHQLAGKELTAPEASIQLRAILGEAEVMLATKAFQKPEIFAKLDTGLGLLKTNIHFQGMMDATTRNTAARMHYLYGDLLEDDKKRLPEREEMYLISTRLYYELAQQYPDSIDLAIRLGWSYQHLADSFLAGDKPSRPTYQEAKTWLGKAIRSAKANPHLNRELIAALMDNYASVCFRLQDWDEAIVFNKQSAELSLQLHQETKEHAHLRQARSTLKNFTNALIEAKRFTDAQEICRLRLELARNDAGETLQANVSIQKLFAAMKANKVDPPADLYLLQNEAMQQMGPAIKQLGKEK